MLYHHCVSIVITLGGLIALNIFSSEAFVPGLTPVSAMGNDCFRRKWFAEKDGEMENSGDEPVDGTSVDNTEKIKRKTSNPFRLAVLKLGFTEPAWTSSFNYQKKDGSFSCAFCGQELFDSNAKYDSGSGWPSFWRSSSEGSIALHREWDGRVECSCSNCRSHLGHVFMDGPRPGDVSRELRESIPDSDPKGRNSASPLPRFCINGAALSFDERK